MGIYEDYLMHFNPNHDPETGQFTSKGGLGVRILSRKIEKAGSAADRRKKHAEYSNRNRRYIAYLPFVSRDTAVRLLGPGFQKRLKSVNHWSDKAAKRGARAYAKLLRKYGQDAIPQQIDELGKRLTDQYVNGIKELEMDAIYKAIEKEHNLIFTSEINKTRLLENNPFA